MRSVDLAPEPMNSNVRFETSASTNSFDGQHAAVGAGVEPLRQCPRPEAPQVHRHILIEAVVDLRAIVVVVVHLEPVFAG